MVLNWSLYIRRKGCEPHKIKRPPEIVESIPQAEVISYLAFVNTYLNYPNKTQYPGFGDESKSSGLLYVL
jgi:hypothetical protein